ncbi:MULTISPECIES: hypothetical protein [Leptolyngbya]|uniref:hypothetical protein n=1 Tax=Leptolyngbya TaxID=47251 RepID=UPI001687B158|nr:hypothetical protein [Leptolyngbya sp. FACHB-1624]MBD1857916.1 hypothetical protein [Leptolyngbya sp. FACHB-1624]
MDISNAGYEHSQSKAVRGNPFCGLAIDEDNPSDLTDDRVQAWVTQLKPDFGI